MTKERIEHDENISTFACIVFRA